MSNPGSFAPPSTWEELKLALLDILMPSNSVEECAIKLATFRTENGETVFASELSFRVLLSRFDMAVERHSKGRTAWAATTVSLWQHSLPPALQLLQSERKTVASLKEAVERARRYEAARLTGGAINIITMSFTPIPNRAVVCQLQSPRRQQRKQGRQQQTNRQQPRQRGTQGGSNQRKPRPHRTYDRCDKPVEHWESRCLRKARNIRSRHFSKRDRSNFLRGNSRRLRRHHRDDDDENNDDAEDDRWRQASSTRGVDN